MRPVLLAALAAALAGAAPAAHAAPSPAQLLARHQPVVVLHSAERFRPVAVDPFLASASLEQAGPGGWAAVGSASGPLPVADPAGCVATGQAPCWRLRDPRCAATAGVPSVPCFARLDAGAAPTMYGAYHRRGNRIALQYWLWYRYNFYSGRFPVSDYVWNAHEGDWEVVTVVLSARAQPLLVGYSEHACGKRRSWARVARQGGTHPVVYPALGSHANYVRAGVQRFDLRPACYPRAGAYLLRYFLRPPVERTGGGRRYGPALRGVTRAALVRVTATSPQWMSYPGRWGEWNWFHVPSIPTQPAGPAPDGPAFHAIWRDPVGIPSRWRVG